MLREMNLNVVFFIEAKLHRSKMEEVRRIWGFVEGINVSSEGT